jgi:glycosyltransferase involved in cell wall biosynthesis
MKVLLVNTYNYLRGGDCKYTLSLANLLRRKGHEVFFFGMKDQQNLPSPQDDLFVSHIDFVKMNKEKNVVNGLRVLSRSIYSIEAQRNIGKLIARIRPDIAHLQSIHGHLTPSVIVQLNKQKIPVLWTLHDYKLICPETHLLSHGEICEDCKGGRYQMCTLKKCKKNSVRASLVATLEANFHRFLHLQKRVDKFISPSKFLRNKFISFGWDQKKIVHIPYPSVAMNEPAQFLTDDRYVLYVGQLETWKGLETFLRAAEELPALSFRIAGDGSQRLLLEEHVRKLGLRNVTFEGWLSGDKLKELQSHCSLVVVPSQWYENFPYAVIESLALGKPVIASRIGGIPELIDDGVTGYLFTPNDSQQLSGKIRALMEDDALRSQMGLAAKEKVKKELSPEDHYIKLMQIYHQFV